ncbi:MAG: Ig-like domain-containing protein [Eubacteriales bacterium]
MKEFYTKKKRSKRLIKLMVITTALILLNSSIFMSFGQGKISDKYSGVYITDNIYIDNINKSMKEVSDNITYSAEPEDFSDYRAAMTFSDGDAVMTIEGFSIESTSTSIDGENINIIFEEGYYGFTDELPVVYEFNGVISEGALNGTFTGVILATGLVEADGRIEMEAGGSIVDSVMDIFNGDEETEEAEEEIAEDYVEVTDLLFAEIYKELKVGDSEKVKATIFPREATNKEVIYTSSNPLVVRVSQSGTITAVDKGSANITVTSQDNASHYDVMEVIVEEDYENYTEEEIEKDKIGMTVFNKEKEDKEYQNEFTDIKSKGISEEAQNRADKIIEEIKNMEKPELKIEKKEPDDVPILEIQKTKKIKEIKEKNYNSRDEFYNDAGEEVRKFKDPGKNVIGMVIDKIPKPAGVDVFHEFAKEKAGEYLDSQGDNFKKSEEEIKDQLYETFSSDNTHFALKYLKEKAEVNSFVSLFAYPINKIFGAKEINYKEAVFTEYKSLKDGIQNKINSGMIKEKAINAVKNDFVYNDNFDTTFDAVENSKPGLQRFYAMRQGGKENQVVTGSKDEFHSNSARFEKYLELFEENMEFGG